VAAGATELQVLLLELRRAREWVRDDVRSDSGSYRIRKDIPHQGHRILTVAKNMIVETTLPEPANTSGVPVETSRFALEVPNESEHVGPFHRHREKMDVVRHQAVGEQVYAETIGFRLKKIHKLLCELWLIQKPLPLMGAPREVIGSLRRIPEPLKPE